MTPAKSSQSKSQHGWGGAFQMPVLPKERLVTVGEEESFSLESWPLVGCLCPSECPHSREHTGSLNWTQWDIEKRGCEVGQGTCCGERLGGVGEGNKGWT